MTDQRIQQESVRSGSVGQGWSGRMRFVRSELFICTVLLLAIGLPMVMPSAALADQADDLIRSGIDLRRQGRDQEALETFRKAQALSPTPRAQAQIGLAEQSLGLWVDAFDHLNAALRVKDDPWIAKNRAVLEKAGATILAHLGELEILGGPPGAEVSVEGRPQGVLPLPSRVHAAAGTVSIEVRAPGYLPATRTVAISSGELTRETIVLRPISPLPLPSSGGSIESAREPEPSSTGKVADPAGPDKSPWGRRLAWIGVAGTGVFAAGGAAALVVRQSKALWFEDKAHSCDETLASKGGAGCLDAYQSGQTATTLAVVGFVGAGVFAVGSAVLFVTTRPGPSAHNSATVALACLPSGFGFGVACATRF